MKKAFYNTLLYGVITVLGIFMVYFIIDVDVPTYSIKMADMLKEEYPTYTERISQQINEEYSRYLDGGDYNTKDSKVNSGNYSIEEILALGALSNNYYNYSKAEMELKEKIKIVDPWGNSNDSEKVVTLNKAIDKLGDLKDKYKFKGVFISFVIYPVVYLAVLCGLNFAVHFLMGKSHIKYSNYDKYEDCRYEKEIFPSKEIGNNPNK